MTSGNRGARPTRFTASGARRVVRLQERHERRAVRFQILKYGRQQPADITGYMEAGVHCLASERAPVVSDPQILAG